MRYTVPLSPALAFEVWRHATRYRLSAEDFIRTSLQFAAAMLPGFPGEGPAKGKGGDGKSLAESANEDSRPDTEPDLLLDYCRAVVPTFGLRQELQRVSAMCDDAALKLRSRRLEVEASIGIPPECLGVRLPMYDPMRFVSTKDQQLTVDSLTLLEQLGSGMGYFHLYPVGSEPLELELDSTWQSTPPRIEVHRGDYIRWLPTLRHYRFVPEGEGCDADTSLDVGDTVVAGFLRMLTLLVEGTCFLLQIDPGLPPENLRLDLMLVHVRARKLAAVWRDDLLRTETTLHQLGASRDLLTEKLLILASGVGPSECVFGSEGADDQAPKPQQKSMATPARSVTASSLEAFNRHGD